VLRSGPELVPGLVLVPVPEQGRVSARAPGLGSASVRAQAPAQEPVPEIVLESSVLRGRCLRRRQGSGSALKGMGMLHVSKQVTPTTVIRKNYFSRLGRDEKLS
jgi:hypothetical protein